jgi:hypothetical protein
MLAGFACFAATRKTEAGSGPAGPSLTELRCHLGFTAKYSACFSLRPQTQWITLCITPDCHGMIIANQPLMFT